jgi:hypothetical protein
MSPPPQLATLTMIDHLPCPIPAGCNHFTHWPQPTFLLQIYLTTSLQPRQPTMPPSTSQTNQSALLCWTTTLSCPTAPTRFFRSLSKLTQHNVLHHPPQPIHSPSTTDQPSPTPINPLKIGTLIFYADSENGSHNLWHLGIPFILHNTDHHSPNF